MATEIGPTLDEELAQLAVQVALLTPMRQGNASRAAVPWRTIHAIRSVLDRHGVDWVAMHKAVNG